MAATVSLSIKDVPEETAAALRARAQQNRRSIQGELMHILEKAVANRTFDVDGLRDRLAARALATPAESTQMIREVRDGK